MKKIIVLLFILMMGFTGCGSGDNTTAPAAATAKCADGTFSYSQSCSGTCSGHGGVVAWYGVLSACGGATTNQPPDQTANQPTIQTTSLPTISIVNWGPQSYAVDTLKITRNVEFWPDAKDNNLNYSDCVFYKEDITNTIWNKRTSLLGYPPVATIGWGPLRVSIDVSTAAIYTMKCTVYDLDGNNATTNSSITVK